MGTTVRFVHASDLHLDATFGGVDATDQRVAGALARSTLDALDRIVDLAIGRGVDFLLIAGDLYNSADRSLRAQLHFQRAMRRLAEVGIPALLVHGNHDPADGWSAGLELPDSVIVFPSDRVRRHEVVRDGEVVCAVYGRSYPTRQVSDNYALDFSRGEDDPLAVGLLHANVGKREGHENYAPCTVNDLRSAGMDYWALGHIHACGRVADDPPIGYSGSTQGLNPNEEGPRGCLLVELGKDGSKEEFIDTASVLWRSVEIDASEVEDLEGLREALTTTCETVRRDASGRPTIVRIKVGGRSTVHAQLARPGVLEDLVEDFRQLQLGADPWIWIDRFRDHTRADFDLGSLRQEEGLRGDLVRLAEGHIAEEEAAAAMIEDIVSPVLQQMALDRDFRISPKEVVERARDLCLDLVSGEDP